MTKFDALRAAREELTALNDVLRTMNQRERAAEAAIALAESELNAIRKLRGFCQLSIETARKRMEELSR